MKKAAASLFLIGALVAGCGGGDEGESDPAEAPAETSASASPSEASTPDPEDQAIAEAALLTLDDFPAGWEAEPAEDDEDDREGQKRIAECVGVDFEELYLGDAAATAESPTFTSSNDEEISNQVGVAPDEEWARNAAEIAATPEFRTCMAEELQKTITESAEDDEIEFGETTINELSFRDFGDTTVALRITIPLEAEGFSIEAVGDVVAVYGGRAQTMVTALSIGSPFDVEELEGYVETAVNRLAKELQESSATSQAQ